MPDTIVAKELAGLILVGGSEGHSVSLRYTISGPTAAAVGAPPTRFALEQNYPNPFNPATTIRYTLPSAGRVRLAVYDLLGREVALLTEGVVGAGRHEARLDASAWASGVYLYRLTTAEGSTSRRMVLSR